MNFSAALIIMDSSQTFIGDEIPLSLSQVNHASPPFSESTVGTGARIIGPEIGLSSKAKQSNFRADNSQ